MKGLARMRKRLPDRRPRTVVLCLVIASLGVAAATAPALGRNATSSEVPSQNANAQACGGEGTTLAVSWPNFSVTPAVLTVLRRAKKTGEARGWEVILDDPKNNLNRQVSTIRTWIQGDVDTIMTVTLATQVFQGLARQARAAGVKWINYGTPLPGADAYIGYRQRSDGLKLGRDAGRWITKRLGGRAKVALLTYEPGDWSRGRISGVVAGLRETAPRAQIVARQDALSEIDGLKATRTMLQANPDLSVILGVNDAGATGAYKAWIASGKSRSDPRGFIGGLDGDIQALKLIKQGNTVYRASVAIPLLAVGDAIVKVTRDLVCGKRVKSWLSPTVLVSSQTSAGRARAAQLLKDQGAK
jgi:ribose transport system substrate-binding protein